MSSILLALPFLFATSNTQQRVICARKRKLTCTVLRLHSVLLATSALLRPPGCRPAAVLLPRYGCAIVSVPGRPAERARIWLDVQAVWTVGAARPSMGDAVGPAGLAVVAVQPAQHRPHALDDVWGGDDVGWSDDER